MSHETRIEINSYGVLTLKTGVEGTIDRVVWTTGHGNNPASLVKNCLSNKCKNIILQIQNNWYSQSQVQTSAHWGIIPHQYILTHGLFQWQTFVAVSPLFKILRVQHSTLNIRSELRHTHLEARMHSRCHLSTPLYSNQQRHLARSHLKGVGERVWPIETPAYSHTQYHAYHNRYHALKTDTAAELWKQGWKWSFYALHS